MTAIGYIFIFKIGFKVILKYPHCYLSNTKIIVRFKACP